MTFIANVKRPCLNTSFSGRLDLTLFGACPLRDPFTKEIPKNLKGENLAGIITPNIIFKYEVGVKYSYRAEFNRAALAKRIRELSSSNGFFKTSSFSALLDSSESSSWYKFSSNCEDSRVCDQAKLEKIIDIKKRLVQEVLDNIVLAKIGSRFEQQAAEPPPTTGAHKAADGIRSQCQSSYCQAGALLIDVIAASTGGASKTDLYISNHNHTDVEEVIETTPVTFSGILGFGK